MPWVSAQVFDRFQSVVITSGTLSPLDMYKKILAVQPVVVASFQMSFARDVIRPLVVRHAPIVFKPCPVGFRN